MNNNIHKLVDLLEEDNSYCGNLKERVIKSLGNRKSLLDILEQQKITLDDSDCYSCGQEGFCFAVRAIIYFSLDRLEDAINELNQANSYFRRNGNHWNNIIGFKLLGTAYEHMGKRHEAFIEYQQAFHLLEDNYLRLHTNDYIDKASKLQIALKEDIKRTASSGKTAISSADSLGDKTDYLALLAIPVLGTVTAGPNGIIQTQPVANSFTAMNIIEIEGRIFSLNNIKKTSNNDHQITIESSGKVYSWALVNGQSMNSWDIPFNEGDYVLFYHASAASDGDFVIASSLEPFGEIAPIVKQYDEYNRLLISKSNDKSETYFPIPIDAEHQIIGIAIAVAKPV
jgi:SOS-response transcriptional repressor LexA